MSLSVRLSSHVASPHFAVRFNTVPPAEAITLPRFDYVCMRSRVNSRAARPVELTAVVLGKSRS
jgi:hypothetical protein